METYSCSRTHNVEGSSQYRAYQSVETKWTRIPYKTYCGTMKEENHTMAMGSTLSFLILWICATSQLLTHKHMQAVFKFQVCTCISMWRGFKTITLHSNFFATLHPRKLDIGRFTYFTSTMHKPLTRERDGSNQQLAWMRDASRLILVATLDQHPNAKMR